MLIRRTRARLALTTLAVAALALAGCGDGKGDGKSDDDNGKGGSKGGGTLTLAGDPPKDWSVKHELLIRSDDGRANVIASDEVVGDDATTESYAKSQGELLKKNFPQYQEQVFEESDVFGDRKGYIRQFTWKPKGGKPVTQVQMYYVKGELGYTATATTTAENFTKLQKKLTEALRGIRID